MTNESKKPSERLAEIRDAARVRAAREIQSRIPQSLLESFIRTYEYKSTLEIATVFAAMEAWVDEYHAPREKFEAGVLERLDILTRSRSDLICRVKELEGRHGNQSVSALASRASNLHERVAPLEAVETASRGANNVAPQVEVCANCGGKIGLLVFERDGHRFCGYRCDNNYRPGCPRCGGPMGLQSWAVHGVGIFCSRGCAESERVTEANAGYNRTEPYCVNTQASAHSGSTGFYGPVGSKPNQCNWVSNGVRCSLPHPHEGQHATEVPR